MDTLDVDKNLRRINDLEKDNVRLETLQEHHHMEMEARERTTTKIPH